MVEERGVLFLRNRRDRSAEIVPGSERDVKVGRRRSKRSSVREAEEAVQKMHSKCVVSKKQKIAVQVCEGSERV